VQKSILQLLKWLKFEMKVLKIGLQKCKIEYVIFNLAFIFLEHLYKRNRLILIVKIANHHTSHIIFQIHYHGLTISLKHQIK